jgi:hypothetical protein
MWYYTLAVIALWIVNPEIRRIYDWRHGYAEFSPIALLPLLALIPFVLSLTIGGGRLRISRPLGIAAVLWISGFTYALILGLIDNDFLPAVYAFANFVLPIVVGLWIAADEAPFDVALTRVARLLFGVATVVSLYGLFQFARLPAWDAYWLHSIARESRSFGLPFPYQVRVFSMLNSPSILGAVLALTLLASLPYLSLRRPWVLLQAPLWLVTLGLSRDRTGWIMLAVGFAVYLAVARGRSALIASVAVLALLTISSVGVVTFYSGSTHALENISDRFNSMQDLSSDVSIIDRQRLYERRIGDLESAPMGQGLGLFGTATKLSDSARTTDLDSGILGRLIEMGIPGALAMAASLALISMTSLLLLYEARKRGDERTCRTMGLALATVTSILILEISMDATGLVFLYLWLFAALALRAEPVHRHDRFRSAAPCGIAA